MMQRRSWKRPGIVYPCDEEGKIALDRHIVKGVRCRVTKNEDTHAEWT